MKKAQIAILLLYCDITSKPIKKRSHLTRLKIGG